MEFLNRILAGLFDKFKAANPIVAAILLSLIVGFKYFLDSGDYLGVNEMKYDEWVTYVLLALTGSRTTSILSGKDVKK